MDRVRSVSAEILQKVERLGAKAIIFTVDVGWEARINGTISKSSLGAFMAMGGLQDRNLSWDDISWIRCRKVIGIRCQEREILLSTTTVGMIECAKRSLTLTLHGNMVEQTKKGFGRTFLYANGTHGEESVRRVIESELHIFSIYSICQKLPLCVANIYPVLREEIVNTMRNISASTISDLRPEMVGPSGP
jgi:L-lactate dehydrogenase (cytochrome)